MEPGQAAFYRTLRGEGRSEFIEKKSRFAGYAAPAMTEEEAAAFIADVRRRHPDGSSLCWGYRCGPAGAIQRYDNDHEPSGGQAILETLVRQELMAVAAVVRWFGGVKLGAGPLSRAFGRAAALAVAAAAPCRADLTVRLRVEADYPDAGAVERLLNHPGCRPDRPLYGTRVVFEALVRNAALEELTRRIADLTAGRARCDAGERTYMRWD